MEVKDILLALTTYPEATPVSAVRSAPAGSLLKRSNTGGSSLEGLGVRVPAARL